MLAGANMIYGPGMLESGITMSLGQVVADADFVRMIKEVLRGIPVNEETLALDVIHGVGIKGQYLGEKHTFSLFKNFSQCLGLWIEMIVTDGRSWVQRIWLRELMKKHAEFLRTISLKF